MAISSERVDRQFQGLVALHAARNGLGANGRLARSAARAANYLLGRALPVIPGKTILPGTGVRSVNSDLELWRTRYPASPNGTKLIVEVHLLPSNFGLAVTPQWYVTVDGVASAVRTHNRHHAADGSEEYYLGTATVSGSFVDRMEVDVTPGALHTIALCTKGACRVLSWSLREKERSVLDPADGDELVDYSYLAPGGVIVGADLEQLRDVLELVRKHMAGVSLTWNVDDPATPFSPTSDGTFYPVFDDAAITHTVPTQYRNPYMDEIAGTLQIPMRCWVYTRRTAGTGTCKVRFTGANGSTDITVSTPGFTMVESSNFTTKPQSGGDPISISVMAPFGSSMEIEAAGCFPYIT